MTSRRACRASIAFIVCLLLAACRGELVHEVRSEYSHIQVRDFGRQRALMFEGESEIRTIETLIDRDEPLKLQHAYAQTMAAAMLYRPDAQSCLMIGLGGGALLRFFNHFFPALRLDVVEIDPVIVTVARDYFGAVPAPGSRVLVADGYEYLERSAERYDLILVDAHLNPNEKTDSSGVPTDFKSVAFFRNLRERLRPGGVVAFNMLEGRDAGPYMEGIRRAFPATEVYRPSFTGNIIVFASLDPLPDGGELRRRARVLDARGGYGFSFERVLEERKMKPSL
jgi:spermidine synthase